MKFKLLESNSKINLRLLYIDAAYNNKQYKKADSMLNTLYEYYTQHPEDFTSEEEEFMFNLLDKVSDRMYK